MQQCNSGGCRLRIASRWPTLSTLTTLSLARTASVQLRTISQSFPNSHYYCNVNAFLRKNTRLLLDLYAVTRACSISLLERLPSLVESGASIADHLGDAEQLFVLQALAHHLQVDGKTRPFFRIVCSC